MFPKRVTRSVSLKRQLSTHVSVVLDRDTELDKLALALVSESVKPARRSVRSRSVSAPNASPSTLNAPARRNYRARSVHTTSKSVEPSKQVQNPARRSRRLRSMHTPNPSASTPNEPAGRKVDTSSELDKLALSSESLKPARRSFRSRSVSTPNASPSTLNAPARRNYRARSVHTTSKSVEPSKQVQNAARRTQHSQSIHMPNPSASTSNDTAGQNVDTFSESVEAPKSVQNPMNMLKVRSILKQPADKPKSIFGRRKSLPDHVSFQSSNERSNNENEQPLIDLTDNSNVSNSNAGPFSKNDCTLKPALAIKEDAKTSEENVNITHEFDPYAPLTSIENLNKTNWSDVLASDLVTPVSSTSCADRAPPTSTGASCADPVPSTLSGKKFPFLRTCRPVPNLIPLRELNPVRKNKPDLLPVEAFRKRINDILTPRLQTASLVPDNLIYRSIEKLVDGVTNSESLADDRRCDMDDVTEDIGSLFQDDHFGKLRYDSDSEIESLSN